MQLQIDPILHFRSSFETSRCKISVYDCIGLPVSVIIEDPVIVIVLVITLIFHFAFLLFKSRFKSSFWLFLDCLFDRFCLFCFS